ncbi:MAG: sigma-70 family RNA polymerase sigma factor [Ruminococcus sp.]|nr:sigma-70 family RNA polymerase sigma factor [Ruminococcus sp.]
MQKISFDSIDKYLSDSRTDPTVMTDEIKNGLIREAVEMNLTKKQKCYIIMYYVRGMTMQQIADACAVNRSTVSRTIALARKQIAGGISSALLRRAVTEGESKRE